MANDPRQNAASSSRASSSTRGNARIQRVMDALKVDLESGRGARAVRHFVAGAAHQLFPEDRKLLSWLNRKLGKAKTADLINAFAEFPCFYCKKGVEPCPRCDERGHLPGGAVCDTCIGLKSARCDFCDGSGRVTLNYVPAGLRAHVLVHRVKAAGGELKSIVRRIPKNPRPENAEKTLQRCIRGLTGLIRVLGVLENCVVASQAFDDLREDHRAGSSRTTDTCCQLGVTAKNHLPVYLKVMSAACGQLVKDRNHGTATRQRIRELASYYRTLAETADFRGTALEHPFLDEALMKHEDRARANARARRPALSSNRET